MSLTTWFRLDPVARDVDLRTSLMARVADPLWMLARQWQLGEFQGEDTGSPVVAHLEGEVDQLSRTRLGRADATPAPAVRPYDPRALPLETVVERERVRGAAALDQRLPAEAGLHFLRLLAGSGASAGLRGAFLAQYPLAALTDAQRAVLDDDSTVFAGMLAGRSLDGAALAEALRATLRPPSGPPTLPPAPPVTGADVAKVIAAGQAFLDWYDSLFSEPPAGDRAWSGDRMEYAFAASAAGTGGEVVLAAPSYTDGTLDWHTFDLDRSGTPLDGGAGLPAAQPVTLDAQPAPVTFKGMPAHRFWEMEDAQIDLGALDVAPSDLPRLLLMDFAFLHGNDWFVIPWQMEVGSMARVSTLTVTDTFGDVKTIQPASDLDPTWAMFRLSETGVTATSPPRPFKDLLFLAPTVVGGLGGGVLEDVLLARDEMANLAWAIERKIEGPRGSGLDRHEAFQAKQRRDPPPPPPPPPPGGGVAERRYILQTTVPDYWLPLVPVQVPGTTTQLRFRRGLVDRPGGPIPAQGQILEPEHALILNPEEVPRVGARITRAFGLARWTGGQTQLWVGRRKTVSRGESSSGLRYDQAE